MLCSSVFLPVRDNLLSDGQRATLVLTVRYRDSHHSLMLKLFPIGAPSARIVSPSASHSRTTSVGALFRSLFSFASSWPSLLSMFSFMPVASSHIIRILEAAQAFPGLQVVFLFLSCEWSEKIRGQAFASRERAAKCEADSKSRCGRGRGR